MDKNVCKLFVDTDEVFNHGTVNESIFNTSNLYKKYCPNGNCNTNYDRISALCDYLLTELQKYDKKQNDSNNDVNQNYEYVFMWLADKFLKISPNRSFSLYDYYEKVIVKRGENFNCWGKLDNKKDLKDSNLSIMTLFYQIFMNICNAIMKNEISRLELNKFMDIDHSYHQLYELINYQVSNCDPYIQLFVNLNKTYDEYRKLAINKFSKDDLKNILTFLPIINNDDQKDLQFQSQGCKDLHAMFEQSYKPRPKRRQRMPKPKSNDAKIQKEKVEINKGESNKSTNSTEKHNEPQKETQPPESKAPVSSQKSDTQAQILPKSSQNLQEASPNNKNPSSNATDASKYMENVSENQVNSQELAKTRSRRSLSLQQNHHTPNHNESLSQLSETIVEKNPVESSDKLPDNVNGPAKRTKREIIPPVKSPNQGTNPETNPSDSLSLENPKNESSSIENIIDYSVNIFQTYSSLFNNTVNMIEDYIQDIVMSKINDIIDKIIKYQPIIQKIGSTIGQIQIVNDHQNESKKSQKICEKPQNEKLEQPTSTQTNEGSTGCLNDTPPMLVAEPGNNVMGLNGNIAKLLSSKFGGYKVAIMALMAVSIPIALVIMYKYLYYGCGKTSKKKKMVKKIINSHNGKRTVKKIINPIDGKRNLKTVINPIDGKNTSNIIISPINVKRTLKTVISSIDEENTENATISPNCEETNVKTIINSDCEKKTTIVIINSYDEKDVTIQSVKSSSPKTTSLKGYKHIFANPAPFINLFFLLIFFVYKKKYNFL
ncbi:CIR protein [Plasmodium chabaudi chabaudi]|uniref:CIR protein n=1 Tax=Plasmodium chabaudi chabaudi TaxID=31271 RepID=A0A4V0K4L2_PLACU|nr:CIR protein [Plasmodium chabaudi chabaudi]VTZ67861.1 CIR protein [Plasmodium chabaudi chabaudi]|eukprot:XP_016654390.1 CIR protein [Plasmodium chabaudi chabaudi]